VNCSHMVYAGGCCNTVPLEGPAAQELRASRLGTLARAGEKGFPMLALCERAVLALCMCGVSYREGWLYIVVHIIDSPPWQIRAVPMPYRTGMSACFYMPLETRVSWKTERCYSRYCKSSCPVIYHILSTKAELLKTQDPIEAVACVAKAGLLGEAALMKRSSSAGRLQALMDAGGDTGARLRAMKEDEVSAGSAPLVPAPAVISKSVTTILGKVDKARARIFVD
jgi:hypothetical protein